MRHRNEVIEAMWQQWCRSNGLQPKEQLAELIDAIPPAYHLAVVCGPCPARCIDGWRSHGSVGGDSPIPCPVCKGTGSLIGGALYEVAQDGPTRGAGPHLTDLLRERFG